LEDVIRNFVSALVGGVAPVVLGFPDSVCESADSFGRNESLCLEEVGVQYIEASSAAKSEHKGGVLGLDLGLAGSDEQVSLRVAKLLIDSRAIFVSANNVSVDVEVSGQQNQLALREGSLGLDEVDGGGYLGHPDVEGIEDLLLSGVVVYCIKLEVEEVEGLVQFELYLCVLNTIRIRRHIVHGKSAVVSSSDGEARQDQLTTVSGEAFGDGGEGQGVVGQANRGGVLDEFQFPSIIFGHVNFLETDHVIRTKALSDSLVPHISHREVVGEVKGLGEVKSGQDVSVERQNVGCLSGIGGSAVSEASSVVSRVKSGGIEDLGCCDGSLHVGEMEEFVRSQSSEFQVNSEGLALWEIVALNDVAISFSEAER